MGMEEVAIKFSLESHGLISHIFPLIMGSNNSVVKEKNVSFLFVFVLHCLSELIFGFWRYLGSPDNPVCSAGRRNWHAFNLRVTGNGTMEDASTWVDSETSSFYLRD